MDENKTNINWLISIKLRTLLKPYKIMENKKMHLAYF